MTKRGQLFPQHWPTWCLRLLLGTNWSFKHLLHGGVGSGFKYWNIKTRILTNNTIRKLAVRDRSQRSNVRRQDIQTPKTSRWKSHCAWIWRRRSQSGAKQLKVKLSLCTAWKNMGERRYSSTDSRTRHWMVVVNFLLRPVYLQGESCEGREKVFIFLGREARQTMYV